MIMKVRNEIIDPAPRQNYTPHMCVWFLRLATTFFINNERRAQLRLSSIINFNLGLEHPLNRTSARMDCSIIIYYV